MFLYSQWISLPLSTRAQIAHKFGIAKTSSTHVVGNEVVSDGYKIQDVERVLTSDAVKEYVGVDTDPVVFMQILVDKLNGKYEEPKGVVPLENEPEKPKKVTKRKK